VKAGGTPTKTETSTGFSMVATRRGYHPGMRIGPTDVATSRRASKNIAGHKLLRCILLGMRHARSAPLRPDRIASA